MNDEQVFGVVLSIVMSIPLTIMLSLHIAAVLKGRKEKKMIEDNQQVYEVVGTEGLQSVLGVERKLSLSRHRTIIVREGDNVIPIESESTIADKCNDMMVLNPHKKLYIKAYIDRTDFKLVKVSGYMLKDGETE